MVQNQKTEPLPHTETGSKNEKIKPQNPWNALFSGISAVPHCINFGVAMFPYTCGYFSDRCLKFLSLKNAPKLTFGCIVSNSGTQASKTVFRQISTRFLQSDHCVQIGQAGRSKWPWGRSLHLTTVFKRLWGVVKSDPPQPTGTDSHALPAQPQNQTRDSSNTQCTGTPCFQRFFQYSVHALCIN